MFVRSSRGKTWRKGRKNISYGGTVCVYGVLEEKLGGKEEKY